MYGSTRGFTRIEAAMMIVMGTIIISVAVSASEPAQRAYSVSQARQAMASLHARTRAHAIEGGRLTRLNVDFHGDRAEIVRAGSTLESLDFGHDLSVDLQGPGAGLTICMNARGYGEAPCSSFDAGTDIVFAQGDVSRRMRVYPLGQVVIP